MENENEYKLNGFIYWFDASKRLWVAIKDSIRLSAETMGDIQESINKHKLTSA